MPPPDDLSRRILTGGEVADTAKARRQFFALLREAGLDSHDVDRRDLARFVLGRRIESFTTLDASDWTRLLDSIRGWYSITELRRQRGLPPV